MPRPRPDLAPPRPSIRWEKRDRGCYLPASIQRGIDLSPHRRRAGSPTTRRYSCLVAPHLTASVIWATAGIFAVLAVATAAASAFASWRPQRDNRELLARVWTWWLMIGVFSIALMLGGRAMLVFFGLVSFLALKEYLSVIPI